MAAEVIESAVDDDFSDITGEVSEDETPGPVTGTRGTRKRRTGKAADDGSAQPAVIRRRGVRLERKLAGLQKKLSGEMFTGGALIGLALPVTGYYVAQESDGFTSAIVELAAEKPEWIEALEKIANIEPGFIIGRTVVGMGASLAIDRKRLDPAKRESFLKFLGVWTAMEKVASKGEMSASTEGSRFTPPPARSFVPV